MVYIRGNLFDGSNSTFYSSCFFKILVLSSICSTMVPVSSFSNFSLLYSTGIIYSCLKFPSCYSVILAICKLVLLLFLRFWFISFFLSSYKRLFFLLLSFLFCSTIIFNCCFNKGFKNWLNLNLSLLSLLYLDSSFSFISFGILY